MKRRVLSFVCICFFVALFVSKYAASEIPDIKKDCNLCHLPHAMGGAILLKKPLLELCLDCHPDRKTPGDHVVDVTPSMDVHGLPLREGKMTCVTCHDAHNGPFGTMLRVSPEELCQVCHKK